MKRIWWNMRVYLCEALIVWAIKICPDDYTSSIDLALLTVLNAKIDKELRTVLNIKAKPEA